MKQAASYYIHLLYEPRTLNVGEVDKLVSDILSTEAKGELETIVPLITYSDSYVAFRTLQLLDKVSQRYPEWLTPYADYIWNYVEQGTYPDKAMWYLCQLVGRIPHSEGRVSLVIEWLHKILSTFPNKFIQVYAMQALVDIALAGHIWYIVEVKELLRTQMDTGTASMRARCRKLMKRVEKIGK